MLPRGEAVALTIEHIHVTVLAALNLKDCIV
jgi:hypothetical protein